MTLPPRRSPDGLDETPDIAMLQATDALLDRLGRREPTADDLDDPLLASLALLAAEVDQDEVSVSRTRRVLQVRNQWPPVVLDTEDAGLSVLAHGTPPAPAGFGAIAPPRALPRTPEPIVEAPSGYDEDRVRIRLLPAVAAAVAAVVLSMTAAAAVTGGQSVNPQRVVQYVIEKWQGASPTPGRSPAGTNGSTSGSKPNKPAGATPVGKVGTPVSTSGAKASPEPSASTGTDTTGASGTDQGASSGTTDGTAQSGAVTGGSSQAPGDLATPHSVAPTPETTTAPAAPGKPNNAGGNGNGQGNGQGNGKPKSSAAAS